MHLLLHEWSCSGGLPIRAKDPAADAPFAAGLAAEGMAMLAALLRDASRAPDIAVSVLLDERLLRDDAGLPPPPVRVIPVPPAGEIECLAAAAAGADRTLVVAPETGGLLATRVAAVRAAGGDALASDLRLIEAASDKQATASLLAARGVAVPAGTVVPPGGPLPAGFRLPAVTKARASCGGDGFGIVRGVADFAPAPLERRIEALAEGIPVGVSCLCGPGGHVCLPPARQRFSPGGRYLGGDFALAPAAASRARALAMRALDALERATGPARGWLGVDMVLGDRHDGAADRVLEINPRLTTSFVGLSAGWPRSLLRCLLETADGDSAGASHPGPLASFAGRPFDAT